MAERQCNEGHFEIVGFEGGRMGRVLIEAGARLARVAPADLVQFAQFGDLPTDDQDRVRWLARRQACGALQ